MPARLPAACREDGLPQTPAAHSAMRSWTLGAVRVVALRTAPVTPPTHRHRREGPDAPEDQRRIESRTKMLLPRASGSSLKKKKNSSTSCWSLRKGAQFRNEGMIQTRPDLGIPASNHLSAKTRLNSR